VPDTVLALLHDEVPVIRSHGKHVRDFLYVLDAVEAYLLLAEKLHEKGINGEAFNFALGEPVSVLEMVERIASLCGREQVCPKVLGQLPAPAEILSQYLSAEKARERLGWKPRYTLDDGLRDTIDWYRRWQQARESDTISLLDLDRELIRRFEES
jgi:CDP-glucose 4,6-dehydratase